MKIINKVTITQHTIREVTNLVNLLKRKDVNSREVIYLSANNPDNLRLKYLLTEIGCFAFHSSNSGEYIIGVSQIIGYLYYGWKAYQRGITINQHSHQWHHIDSNVENNSKDNLICLSIEDHKLVSLCQQGLLDVTVFEPSGSDSKVSFNKQGEIVKDRVRFLKAIIAKTLMATRAWIERTAQGKAKIKSIKEVVSWILNQLTPRSLISELMDLSTSFIAKDDVLAMLALKYNIYF